MSDTKNVKLGVCKIYFDGEDLGYTQGGVQVTVETETHKVNVDQFGNTSINEVIMGRNVTATVPLAETTLENMVKIMPGASLVEEGGAKATGRLTVASVPAEGDTVTVNGVVITFRTANPVGNEVLIGATAAATATALAAFLNGSNLAALSVASYSAAAAIITVSFDKSGVAGNAFTLAAGQASVTVQAMSGGVVPTKRMVEVTTAIGQSLLDYARELRLHPINLPDTNKSEDFVIPLAATAGGLEFAYELEQERIFNSEFTGYPDPNTGKLFRVGE